MPTIGAFVFRDDGDGCLTAKWLDNSADTFYPEACKLIANTGGEHKFEGQYISTWIEQSVIVVESTLTISQSNPGIYTLEWVTTDSHRFHGKAMTFGDLLIGSYWD